MIGRMIGRLVILFIIAFGLGSALAFYRAVSRPIAGPDQTVSIIVEKGDGPRAVAKLLKEQGIVANERPFLLYVLISGKRNTIYPGNYQITNRMSIADIVKIMSDSRSQELTVRILEGWRITDIATEIARKTKITADDFLTAAPVETYEGYLYPDTYFFSPETTADEAVKIMHDHFLDKTKSLSLTSDDVILASIVEREAKTDEDRAMVAGVYLNRLKAGIALQADPTVQYAKGSWEPITLADYRSVESAYNTYLHAGLPPGPIASPSLASLKAVKSPTEHDYLYFIHASDGKTYYAKTLDEHNANKRKYL